MFLRTERGVGLIEVLVSLLVVGIGLLGVVALYVRSQQAEMESYQRAQALILLEDMVNRLNANRSAAACYAFSTSTNAYVGAGAATVPTCLGVGTSRTRAVADADLAQWHDLLRGAGEKLSDDEVGGIIGARGCIHYDATDDLYRISVAWQGLSPTVSPAAVDAANVCAQGEYGDDAQRRLIATTVRLAELK